MVSMIAIKDIDRELTELRLELIAEREPAVRGRLRQAIYDLVADRVNIIWVDRNGAD